MERDVRARMQQVRHLESDPHRVWELREACHVVPLHIVLVVVVGGRRRARDDERVVADERGEVVDVPIRVNTKAQIEVVARVSEAEWLTGLERAIHGDKVEPARAQAQPMSDGGGRRDR